MTCTWYGDLKAPNPSMGARGGFYFKGPKADITTMEELEVVFYTEELFLHYQTNSQQVTRSWIFGPS